MNKQITHRRLQPPTKEKHHLGKVLVCPLLLLTYTFTPKTWKSFQPFWSQKPSRRFCSFLVLAEEQAYPWQAVLLHHNPPPPKLFLQHHWLHPTHQWGGWGWVGGSPPFGITEGTDMCSDVWTAPQEASGQNKLGLSRRSLGFWPSTAHFSTFPRQESSQFLSAGKRLCAQRPKKTGLQEDTQPKPRANTSSATAGQKSKANSTKQIINQVGNYTELIGAAVKPSLSQFQTGSIRTATRAAISWCNERAHKCVG